VEKVTPHDGTCMAESGQIRRWLELAYIFLASSFLIDLGKDYLAVYTVTQVRLCNIVEYLSSCQNRELKCTARGCPSSASLKEATKQPNRRLSIVNALATKQLTRDFLFPAPCQSCSYASTRGRSRFSVLTRARPPPGALHAIDRFCSLTPSIAI
jgi:hypothetical protein